MIVSCNMCHDWTFLNAHSPLRYSFTHGKYNWRQEVHTAQSMKAQGYWEEASVPASSHLLSRPSFLANALGKHQFDHIPPRNQLLRGSTGQLPARPQLCDVGGKGQILSNPMMEIERKPCETCMDYSTFTTTNGAIPRTNM